jgi:hypothetical protein
MPAWTGPSRSPDAIAASEHPVGERATDLYPQPEPTHDEDLLGAPYFTTSTFHGMIQYVGLNPESPLRLSTRL